MLTKQMLNIGYSGSFLQYIHLKVSENEALFFICYDCRFDGN